MPRNNEEVPTRADIIISKDAITSHDFAVGLLMALVKHGVTVINIKVERAFHAAVQAAYDEAEVGLDLNRYAMRFNVIRNQFHGISGDVESMLSYLSASGLLVPRDLRQPHLLHAKVVRNPKQYIEQNVPGELNMYMKAADTFLRNFEWTNLGRF